MSIGKLWYLVPILLIVLIALVLYNSELLGWTLPFSHTERTTIILSSAITIFAALEGYSTHRMVELDRKRHRIEDIRNELEKAYGPLYTLLNRHIPEYMGEIGEELCLNFRQKEDLDDIIATHPFMFSSETYGLWRSQIQNLDPEIQLSPGPETSVWYDIPPEFRDRINEEYDRRVKEYNQLLKK